MEPEQTPSDLGMSADTEELVAIVTDEEVDAVMKRGGVGLLEAAEALDRCGYLPRKALQVRIVFWILAVLIVVATVG